jgi:hypothetical protein
MNFVRALHVGMFLDKGRVCMFVIDGEDQHDQMVKINTISSVVIMERSAVQDQTEENSQSMTKVLFRSFADPGNPKEIGLNS